MFFDYHILVLFLLFLEKSEWILKELIDISKSTAGGYIKMCT